jgi:PhnB protein
MKLIPYLNFEGNCEEALNTYQKIFNGEIEDLNRFGDSFPVEDSYKSKIMHARLTFDGNTMMFSDTMPGGTVKFGNGINLSIALADEQQARSVFNQLAVGGNITMPMEKQFWGALFGQVTDKFGINWMLNCEI